MFAAAGQAQAFLATVYAGLAAGLAYDLLRIVRRTLKAGKLFTAILDILFWALTACLVACAVALAGVGSLRFYLLLGTACGLLLWAAGLRRVMLWAEKLVGHVFERSKAGKGEVGRE